MASKTRSKKPKEKKLPEPPVKKASIDLYDLELVSDALVAQAVHILGPLDGQRVLICAGKGQTSAAGIASAVKFIRDGARPHILLSNEADDMTDEGRVYLKQAEVLRVPITQWAPTLQTTVYTDQDLIVDALLGAGTSGDPRYPLDQIIKSINDSRTPVLCMDVPSGLDPKTGKPGDPTVVGMVTLQIQTPTEKLLSKTGALYVGKVAKLNN